eukprot:TRINITY_DN5965_c0_g1_i1.p1 TRINITY_DN5965_c0_g1~~TRINITY_DN5965_c0_g1_i1.p1  ORF type:complete len:522 (-),score=136.25 TRINITY_DN5965_c0_g1_i1:134-1699(-)
MPSFHNKRQCFWFNRWFTYAASYINLFTGGTTYLWGTYSDDLKKVLGLTQSQTSLLGVSFYFAQAGSFIIGLSFDTFGPRPLGWASAILMFMGYFLFRQGVLGRWPVYLLSACLIMVGLGSSGIYTATVPTNINNFHIKHKGKVVGSLVAMTGFSAAALSAIYKYIFIPNYDDLETRLQVFFLLLALLLGLGGSFGVIFLNMEPKDEDLRRSRLSRMPAIERMSRLSYHEYDNRSSRRGSLSLPNSRRQSIAAEESNPLLINSIEEALDEWVPANFGSLANEFTSKEEYFNVAFPQYKWYETLKSINFWLLLPSSVICTAAGAMIIAIIPQLVVSLGLDKSNIPILVSLIAVVNASSRLITGIVSDLLAKNVSRPFFFVFFSALFACTHTFLSFSTTTWELYLVAIFIGFCYGSVVLLGPVLINELFGAKYWGINYAFLNMGPAGGNYLFASVIASSIYQSHIPPEQDDQKVCHGQRCFKAAFVITSICCAASMVLSLLLWYRTRSLYALKYRGAVVNLKK